MTPDFTTLYKRWSTGTARKEDIMRPTFILIDENGLLNTEQKNALYENAALGFKLDTFNSLADILEQQGVEVHICKGIPERSEKLSEDYLDEAEMYWRSKLQSKIDPERVKAERAIGAIKGESDYIKKTKLRGCYFPKRKIIELYPEEMATEYKGKRMNELLVSTLAHEVMHAYFDRAGHDYYPNAYFVEEPLAEFGMLLFLRETGLFDILAWAEEDVASKPSCYHYGAVLYDQYMNWNPFLRRYLEEYKYNINKYEMLDVASDETAVGLPCPISVVPCGVSTATTTMATTSSTGRFNFDSESKIHKANGSVYFSTANIKNDTAFQLSYPNTSQIRFKLTIMAKSGAVISSADNDASFYKRTQNLFIIGNLKTDFVNHFGSSVGVKFAFREITPASSTTPAEWIAQEL